MKSEKNHLKDYVVWLMAIAVLLWSSVAFGSRIDVPGDYATIQAAVTAAEPGDEVVVADGIYTGAENVGVNFYGKAIILRSENGPENCIIDGEGTNHPVFLFYGGETADTQLVGFTIRNGNFNSGAAVYCVASSSPTIKNCILDSNSANYGGAVCCRFASPTFINCVMIRNSALRGGGAIFLQNSNAKFIHCTLSDNSAPQGPGMFCHSSFPSVVNSILWNDHSMDVEEIHLVYGSNPDVVYSDLKSGWNGEGNMDSDPLFVAYGDARLSEGSPCIDAGTSGVGLPEFDFEGDCRVLGQGPDMGADESTVKGFSAVDIDIKPGGNRNSINLKSRGVVAVAVLNTETFNVFAIDFGSIQFAGATALRGRFEDVDQDGDDDVVFHFETQALDLTEESTEAELTGALMDDTAIVGTDHVRIVPARVGKAEGKGKGKKK
jgi:hypothetical protein